MTSGAFSLAGHTAVISGAGRGLARAIAIGFCDAGANIVIGSRTRDELNATLIACRDARGKAVAEVTDIQSRSDCRRLVDRAVAEFGGVTIAVCSAAVGLYSPAENVTEEDWDTTIKVSLTGYFNLAQAAGRQMIAQGRGGSIIAISANSSMVAYAEMTAAAAAKGGVDQMCRNLALEWGPHGIRVNSVNPGYTEHVPAYGDVSTGAGDDLEAGIRMMTPLGRRGRIEEFVWPSIFLASSASSFMTGQSLVVDGGYTIK